jgi:hypothetical protein
MCRSADHRTHALRQWYSLGVRALVLLVALVAESPKAGGGWWCTTYPSGDTECLKEKDACETVRRRGTANSLRVPGASGVLPLQHRSGQPSLVAMRGDDADV